MYNPLLDTFILVADCGSFNKAAEKLYVSPTAIMKQMNTLESYLNLTLIKRSRSGIQLTESGNKIYQDAKFLIDYSQKSISEAKTIETAAMSTFCVGTSLLNPAKPFMDIWSHANHAFSQYKLHLVPFEDNHNGILSEIGKLGEKFDFLIGVCDSKAWLSMCNFLPLGRYKKMIAVSREHPLSCKKKLNLSDLYGETLMMVGKGDSSVNDFIRNDLNLNHPQIKIEDTPLFYDLSVFNRCAETGNVLLTIECWKDVHPGLVSIPVEWDYSIPYGLLYSHDAPKYVIHFINTIRNIQY